MGMYSETPYTNADRTCSNEHEFVPGLRFPKGFPNSGVLVRFGQSPILRILGSPRPGRHRRLRCPSSLGLRALNSPQSWESTNLGVDSESITIALSKNRIRFSWVSGGFQEGSLERMGKIPLEQMGSISPETPLTLAGFGAPG